MAVKFSNNFSTELASAITSSATSIQLLSVSGLPTLGAGDYTYLTIDTDTASPTIEVVKVTAINTSTKVVTVVRGQDGTTASAFGAGIKVELRLNAALLNDVATEASQTDWTDVQNKPDPTVFLTGDATGQGTLTDLGDVTISVTVVDDSHNHTVANVDGLQAALDAKQNASTALTTSTTFGGDVSGTYNAIVIADDSHTHDTRYYTETEIDNYFSGSSAITGYNKTNWDTAYGWGDHSVEGYLTGNQTITLTGDVSGSGTTSISVTIADDSHNHVISNVDGLQSALDAKLTSSSALSASNITSGTLNNARLEANVFVNDGGTYSVGFADDVNDVTGFQVLRVTGFTGTDHRAFGVHHNMINIPNTSSASYVAQIGFETGGTGLRWRSSSNGTFTSWYDVWHSGNDGAGSSLDADLLDGQHGSYYAPASSLSGYVAKTGDTMSGNLSFSDGAKAIFGAGSDLQIYHDGSHSYVSDQGTGNLRILAQNFTVRNPANNESMIIATPDAGVTLYYDNSSKFATTSTGIDVTGTVTADELKVGATERIYLDGGSDTYIQESAANDLRFFVGGSQAVRVRISGTDILGTVTADGLTVSGDSSFGNITTSGYLRGPASFTIDPATHGDDTGTVIIAGNLQVDGTTTTINSTTLTVDDKNIVLADGAANAAAADGAGITIDGANATLTYDNADGNWLFNKTLHMVGVQRITNNGFAGIEYHNTDGTWEVYIGTDGATGNARYNSRQGTHKWYSNSTEIAALTSSGNFSTTGTLTANKVILPSVHNKQKIGLYGPVGTGAEWIGTSNSTLELSGGSINLNGASGSGTPNLKMGGTTVIDSSRNLHNLGYISIGDTTTATIDDQSDYSSPLILRRTSNAGKGAIVMKGSDNIGTAIEFGRSNSASHWGTYLDFLVHNNNTSDATTHLSRKLRIDADGLTAYSAINITGPAEAIVARKDQSGSAWSARIVSTNYTTGVSSFLGNYNGYAGVFAHNAALTAWAPIYINALNGSGQANVYTGPLYVDGNNLAWHAGNFATGADSRSFGTLNAATSYSLNGTTVIDNSRNLTNLGTISSGAITSSGDIKTGYNKTISMDYDGQGSYHKGMSGLNQSTSTARGLHLFNYDNDSNQGINFWVGTNAARAQALHIASNTNVNINSGNLLLSGDTFVDAARRNIYLDSSNGGDGNGIFFRDGFTSGSLAYNCSITVQDHNGNYADGLHISGGDGVSIGTGGNSYSVDLLVDISGNTTVYGSLNTVGGYQLNGTTVIDSSRNLTNITSLSAGGSQSGSANSIFGNTQYALTVQNSSRNDNQVYYDTLFIRNTNYGSSGVVGQKAQIGLATVDSDGDHHRAQIIGKRDTGGSSYSGQLQLLTRNAGASPAVALTLRYDQSAEFAGNVLVNQASAVGAGGTPPDINGSELGKGYLNLSRDDFAHVTQIQFGKNGSVAGRIHTDDRLSIGTGSTGIYFYNSGNSILPYDNSAATPSDRDDAIDLGSSSTRFKNLYLSGTISSGSITSTGHIEVRSGLRPNRAYDNSAIWFTGSVDTNHCLWNDYYGGPTTKGNAGSGFDGILWNTYRGLHVRGGLGGAYNLIVAENSSGSSNNHYVRLYQANSERFRTTSAGISVTGAVQIAGTTVIDSARNLTNIGTGNFSGKVDFQGDAAIEGGSGYGIFKGYTSNNNHMVVSRGIVTGTTSSPTITGGHNLTLVEYCNTTDTTGFYFKTSDTGTYYEIARITRGGITSIGNVTAYSDIRIKEEIQEITGALDKVKAIRGVTFKRKDDDRDRRHAGVIAQEVEAVLPEVITDNEDGMKSVAYGNMVGLLIEAMKEQQTQIEALQAKIEELENGNH